METFLHTYQRTADKGVFLYRIQERIMLYTIMSVLSRTMNVSVAAVSFMFTHVHALLPDCCENEGRAYMGKVMSKFTRELNKDSGRSGKLFGRADCALKRGEKAVRTVIAYLYNNPVEKKLYSRAIEDRWNFLAYTMNDHPFSNKIILRKSSRRLRDSLSMVNGEHERGAYLNLQIIRTLYHRLSAMEANQLTDYIIVKYRFIDYDKTIKYFRDLDTMMLAIDSNTGSEYDLNEEYDPYSEQPVVRMCIEAKKIGLLEKDMKVYTMDAEQKKKYVQFLATRTNASPRHVQRFLHLSHDVHIGLQK